MRPGSRALNNLADLLQTQPGRLAEARQLAEEALAIKQTLDPGAAEIWTTYNILAEIADQEARPPSADRPPASRNSKPRPANTAASPAKPNATSPAPGMNCSSTSPLILATVMAVHEPRAAGSSWRRRCPTWNSTAGRTSSPPSAASSPANATPTPSARTSTSRTR